MNLTRIAALQGITALLADPAPFSDGILEMRFYTAGPSVVPPVTKADFTYGAGQFATATDFELGAGPVLREDGAFEVITGAIAFPLSAVLAPITILGVELNYVLTPFNVVAYYQFPQPITLLDPTDRIVYAIKMIFGKDKFDCEFINLGA